MNVDKCKRQEELEKRLGEQIAENSSTQSLQRAYDEFHGYILKYGIRNAPPEGYVYKKGLSFFDRLLLRLIGKNRKVLDIGCGEGTLALACAKDNNVTGLDISNIMVELANSRTGSSQAEFQVGDARDLRFPDNSFDVVICKDVVEHIPEKDLATHLQEVRRVLKEGGFYLLYTPSKLLGDLSLGLHFKMYGLTDMVPILRKNNFRVEVICHWLALLGLPAKISNPMLISAILAYEELLWRMKIGRFLARLGNLSYIIVPPVWLCATKDKP